MFSSERYFISSSEHFVSSPTRAGVTWRSASPHPLSGPWKCPQQPAPKHCSVCPPAPFHQTKQTLNKGHGHFEEAITAIRPDVELPTPMQPELRASANHLAAAISS